MTQVTARLLLPAPWRSQSPPPSPSPVLGSTSLLSRLPDAVDDPAPAGVALADAAEDNGGRPGGALGSGVDGNRRRETWPEESAMARILLETKQQSKREDSRVHTAGISASGTHRGAGSTHPTSVSDPFSFNLTRFTDFVSSRVRFGMEELN
jgi:hypothetical protein